MYIYLDNNEELRGKLVISNPAEATGYLNMNGTNVFVYSAKNYPFVKTNDTEIESIMQNDCIGNFFLKAVDITFPIFNAPRECGKYECGTAKADLRITKDEKFRLKIECDSFDDLLDMQQLSEMIYAGTIRPTLSYEKKQVRRFKIFLAKLLKKKERRYFEDI